MSILLWRDISARFEAYSLLRSRSRRAIERVGRVERRDRSIIRTYVHTRPTGHITTAFVPRLEYMLGRRPGPTVGKVAWRNYKIVLRHPKRTMRSNSFFAKRRNAIPAVTTTTVCVHPIYMPFS